jgi:hypothetical protein
MKHPRGGLILVLLVSMKSLLLFCILTFAISSSYAFSIKAKKECLPFNLVVSGLSQEEVGRLKTLSDRISCADTPSERQKTSLTIETESQGLYKNVEVVVSPNSIFVKYDSSSKIFPLEENKNIASLIMEILLKEIFSWELSIPKTLVGLVKDKQQTIYRMEPESNEVKTLLQDRVDTISFLRSTPDPQFFSFTRISSKGSNSVSLFDLSKEKEVFRINTPYPNSSGISLNSYCDRFMLSLYERDGHGIYEYDFYNLSWRLRLQSNNQIALAPQYLNYSDYIIETNRRSNSTIEILKLQKSRQEQVLSFPGLDSHKAVVSPDRRRIAFVNYMGRTPQLAIKDLSTNKMRQHNDFKNIDQIQWLSKNTLLLAIDSKNARKYVVYNIDKKLSFTWKTHLELNTLLWPRTIDSGCNLQQFF